MFYLTGILMKKAAAGIVEPGALACLSLNRVIGAPGAYLLI